MIVAKNICKSYNGRLVLNDVSLTVNDGEFVSIMGESGSGKSTLLGILGGNIKPCSGVVELDGVKIDHADTKALAKLRRTKLGFVYQSLNLIPTLNAYDNIMLPIYLGRADVSQKKKQLEEIASAVGITHVLRAFPEKMSGGEAQRVAIARALLHDPSVLLLDEPTGMLDSKNSVAFLELLSSLNRERGITIVQVTHSKRAAAYGTRIISICDGKTDEI